jgi:N-acetylmuramoyl-L-alanine amidase CwlA
MPKYRAPSPRMIAARWTGGSQTPRLIVMHSTVSPCKPGQAEAVAHFFAGEDNKTSAHYVVDPGTVVQCVGDHTVAYHCGHNQDSIGIELCDMPDQQSQARWNDANHRAMMTVAARLVAQLCLAYNIRPWFVTVPGLKVGRRGVTTHANMSQAFKQSTHWDPGAWPRIRFMRMVRAEVRKIKAGK